MSHELASTLETAGPPATQAPRQPASAARGAGPDVEWTWAADLLHPARLDLVVKYLYFQAVRRGREHVEPHVVRLYERHIARRTGGIEDAKRTVDDYRAAARRLLRSIETSGFDADCAVPIGANGLPCDGAHRIAACLATGRRTAVRRVNAPGHAWDFEWFRTREFEAADLDVVVRTYAQLSDSVVAFVFWSPVAHAWPAMLEEIAGRGGIVGWRDVRVEPDDLPSLIHDIYAWTLGPKTSPQIEQKALALARLPQHLRFVLVDPGRTALARGLASWAADVKADLRRLAGRGPDDFFDTVHATDSAAEARYLTTLLLDGRALGRLSSERRRTIRPELLDWLDAYRSALLANGVHPDQACVVGSAVLEVIGLREATDIDCIVVDGIRRARFHNGITAIGPHADVVTAGYHRRIDGAPIVPDDEIIADPRHHFLFRGLKFASPELVIDRKRQQDRPKDRADVKLWEARATDRAPAVVREATRCVVAWDASPIDPVRQAEWLALAGAVAQHDARLVVAGAPRVPACFPLPGIAGPLPTDELPSDVPPDADPLATLAQAGIDGAALLELDAVHRARPAHPGMAIGRLAMLARTCEWMREWLEALAPAAVLIPTPTPTAVEHLLESAARACGISVVREPSALDDLLATTPAPTARRRVSLDRVCRRASEWTVLIRRAAAADALEARARMAETLAAELPRHRAAVAVLRAALAGRDIWIWGAGAAGRTTLSWLASLGIEPRGVVDSDPLKHGRRFGPASIDPPDVLHAARTSGRPLVVVASIHADAITGELASHGWPDDDIVTAPLHT